MSANFTPDMTGYKGLSPFRFWCQKTLPLVYDDSLSYYELLCKVVSYINNLITDVAAAEENVDKLLTAYNQLQEYVNNYFDGADFQQKIDDSLDRYAEDGTLSRMVNTHVSALLPYEVGQQIGPVVDEDLGPVVDLKLPAVVESKIAAPVATQLPAVVQSQIGGVVGNQIGDVVADQIDEVVADQITDAVSPLVHDEVTGLIRPAVATELPAALQVYLPPEVQTQLPGAIGTDLETIAPPVIEDWLDAHPEATTSVPDGSISFSKLATDLQRRAGIVGTYFPSDFTNEYVWQVNQYAVYQGIVYRCIKTTTVGQAWNASEWTTANMNSDLFYMWWCLNYLSQSITTIDSSPATSAHEAGEYFIYYDGAHLYRLAKASSNIAVGDTLTVNGNFIYSSVANMIADLKVEIADLKSAIEQNRVTDIPLIEKKLSHIQTANVFDKTAAVSGYLDSNGDIISDEQQTSSDFIPVNVGDVIKTYYVANSNVIAANMGTVCGYNADKEFVSGTRNTYINTYTIPDGVAYIRFTIGSSMVDTYMMIVNGSQPTAYIPYENHYIATKDFIDSAVNTYGFATVPISKGETDFWEEEKSANLYDVQDAVQNEYFNSNGTTQSNQNVARAFVALDGAGTYTFNVDGAFFGLENSLKIPCFDINKSYVKYITATTEDTTAAVENLCTLTISDADISDGVAYIGFTMAITLYETEMVVKGSIYPDSFIPYYRYWTIPDLVGVSNPLLGKQIIFDGDSICAGLGSAMGIYGNGWAGRIGVDYGANAINVGVSGACITAETYFDGGSARHWISRYIDTIHTNYPNADYVIAEGGTNDADNFYGDETKLGTFDEADFTGPFDDTTFYGAMDSWCKKALTYYPKAKVGFIVAHKMGTGFVTYVKNRYDYFTYASKVCKKWGIPVLNLWDDGQLRPDVTSMYDPQYNTIETATEHGLPYYDGQHLTAYGYDVISSKIAEWMKTL